MHKSKILALAAAGLVAAALPAWSQGSSRDRDDYDHRDSRSGSYRDRDDKYDRSMRDEGGGARFWIRSGDTRIGVRCDESESMRACVDAALTLFDKVRAQAGSTTPTPAPSTSASPQPSR